MECSVEVPGTKVVEKFEYELNLGGIETLFRHARRCGVQFDGKLVYKRQCEGPVIYARGTRTLYLVYESPAL